MPGPGLTNNNNMYGGLPSSFWGAAGLGNIAGGLFNWMNYQNPADAANPYLSQIPSMEGQYYNPYIQAGQNMLGKLQNQYGQLTAPQGQIQNSYANLAGNLPNVQAQLNQMMQNPGQFINSLGQGYQQSPGFKFSVDQATNAANRAAAAGGMAGSPAEQQALAGTITGLADQDYNNWLNHTLGVMGQGLQGGMGLGEFGLQGQTGLFNRGLSGEEGINQMGYNASDAMARAIQQMLLSQASLAYAGGINQNENQGGDIGSILSGGAALAGIPGAASSIASWL
jgi:hypothetical protein